MKIFRLSQSKIRLWLDDERDPKNPKIQELFGSLGNELWVKTVEEAWPYIKNNQVGFISFDSDLGEGNTEGRKLAQMVEEAAFNGEIERFEWRVHSRNNISAKEIFYALQNADKFWDKQE